MSANHQTEVEDTYAEGFRSIYAEFLITARDRKWLDHALHEATGNASSTILCDCEAGWIDTLVLEAMSRSKLLMVDPEQLCRSTYPDFARIGSMLWSVRCSSESART